MCGIAGPVFLKADRQVFVNVLGVIESGDRAVVAVAGRGENGCC